MAARAGGGTPQLLQNEDGIGPLSVSLCFPFGPSHIYTPCDGQYLGIGRRRIRAASDNRFDTLGWLPATPSTGFHMNSPLGGNANSRAHRLRDKTSCF